MDGERTSPPAHPLLMEQDGARRPQLDPDGDAQEKWREENQRNGTGDHVDGAFHRHLPRRHDVPANGDERRAEQALHPDRSGEDVVDVGDNLHADPEPFELSENGLQLPMIGTPDGQDDLFHLLLPDEGGQLVNGPHAGNAVQRPAILIAHTHDPDEPESRIPAECPDLADHLRRPIVAPDDKGVEGNLAAVDPLDRPGRQRQAEGQDGQDLRTKEHEQGPVILRVGADLVIEDEHEEEGQGAQQGHPEHLPHFLRSVAPEGFRMHAGKTVQANPEHGHEDGPEEEIAILQQPRGEPGLHIGRSQLEEPLPEEEECRPGHHRSQSIPQHIPHPGPAPGGGGDGLGRVGQGGGIGEHGQ